MHQIGKQNNGHIEKKCFKCQLFWWLRKNIFWTIYISVYDNTFFRFKKTMRQTSECGDSTELATNVFSSQTFVSRSGWTQIYLILRSVTWSNITIILSHILDIIWKPYLTVGIGTTFSGDSIYAKISIFYISDNFTDILEPKYYLSCIIVFIGSHDLFLCKPG